ncbi:MAG: hypothetical protein H7067_03845 [Burkholderiales bacterium]|nr:hypothetical protein [Opitutaceae bacterium]
MNALKNSYHVARHCLIIGLIVGFFPFAYSTGTDDLLEFESVSTEPTEHTESDRAASRVKLLIAQEELHQMRNDLHEDKKQTASVSVATDEEIAARAVKVELLMIKQREVAALRRQNEDPVARAERHALQQRLASAGTQDERQVIIERHVAIQSVLAEEAAEQTSTR